MKYEWDLDGNGTFETNTGTTSTTSRVYANAATVNIGLRVTDDDGATGTTIRSLGVKSASYPNAVLATPGLKNYWRMEELSGPTFADSKGSSPATASGGGVAFGSPGALAGPTNMSARFDGVTGSAQANLDLSASTAVTVEFWLKWDAYADNDALAIEFTNNFNQNDGGFLVDPNSADGTFSVAIGRDTSRNAISFTRPSPNQWHHYVFVLDTTVASRQPDHPVRGRSARRVQQESKRHGCSRRSRTRRSISCRAAARASSEQALSTRWRSTAAR